MTGRFRCLCRGFALLAVIGAAVAALAASAMAGRMEGGVGGDLQIEALPALGLRWRMELGGPEGALRLAADAPGVTMRVEAEPSAAGDWRWRIAEGAVDLAEVWPVLKPALAKGAGDWVVEGKAMISGEGVWTPTGGPIGVVKLELREARASSAELAIELNGIEVDIQTDQPGSGVLPPGQSLRVAKITAGGVTAERFEMKFGITAARVLELAVAELDVLGGKARIKPMAIPLNATELVAGAEIEGLSLSQLAALMPNAVSGARGKLSGQVQVGWDVKAGVRINDGGLAIVRSDDAVLSLAPAPGFLTGNMPPRFALLPAWLGPLARWTAPENPAYAPLQAIEMGRVGLSIETLEVKFYPEKAGGERTATVRLIAQPFGSALVEKITIEVNLAGALARVLELGLDERVKLRLRAK